LARRLTTIQPAMTLADAIEITRIHRVAGRTGDRTALVTTRPFRAPHHTISDAGLISGGHVPMPGEVSLAHHGVLFLDERPECRRHVLEVLRQPLEEGVIYIFFLLMCLALLDKVWIDAETRIIQKQMPVHVTAINRNDPPIIEVCTDDSRSIEICKSLAK